MIKWTLQCAALFLVFVAIFYLGEGMSLLSQLVRN